MSEYDHGVWDGRNTPGGQDGVRVDGDTVFFWWEFHRAWMHGQNWEATEKAIRNRLGYGEKADAVVAMVLNEWNLGFR